MASVFNGHRMIVVYPKTTLIFFHDT